MVSEQNSERYNPESEVAKMRGGFVKLFDIVREEQLKGLSEDSARFEHIESSRTAKVTTRNVDPDTGELRSKYSLSVRSNRNRSPLRKLNISSVTAQSVERDEASGQLTTKELGIIFENAAGGTMYVYDGEQMMKQTAREDRTSPAVQAAVVDIMNIADQALKDPDPQFITSFVG